MSDDIRTLPLFHHYPFTPKSDHLQPHQKYNITQPYEKRESSLLAQMEGDYTTNSHYLRAEYLTIQCIYRDSMNVPPQWGRRLHTGAVLLLLAWFVKHVVWNIHESHNADCAIIRFGKFVLSSYEDLFKGSKGEYRTDIAASRVPEGKMLNLLLSILAHVHFSSFWGSKRKFPIAFESSGIRSIWIHAHVEAWRHQGLH